MEEERSRTITVEAEPLAVSLLQHQGSIRTTGQTGIEDLLLEAHSFHLLVARADELMEKLIAQALADGWPPFIEADDHVLTRPEGYSTAIFRIREGGFPEIQLRCRMP